MIHLAQGLTTDGKLYLARECTYSQLQPPVRILSQAFVDLLPGGAIQGQIYLEVRDGRAPCEDLFFLTGEAN